MRYDKKISVHLTQKTFYTLTIVLLVIILTLSAWSSNELARTSVKIHFVQSVKEEQLRYRRQSCSCTRPLFNQAPNILNIYETSTSLCSHYATLRGPHQRVISISMYGARENAIFAWNTSINFLYQLIADMKIRYPSWILRVYHDSNINHEIVCPIECSYDYIDFCNTSSLGNLGSLSSYIPGKVWRFLPVGDVLVDIMASRDLDSPLTKRELDAVNDWIASGKAWHAMRDNPMHFVPMLGGMWGFRPELNRTFASRILQKILDRSLIVHFGDRGDQRFLSENIWPHIADHVIAHDSFLCTEPYGKSSIPWPTPRPHPSNDSRCFVGCSRPCCRPDKYPFGPCPMACRPKNHTDWVMC